MATNYILVGYKKDGHIYDILEIDTLVGIKNKLYTTITDANRNNTHMYGDYKTASGQLYDWLEIYAEPDIKQLDKRIAYTKTNYATQLFEIVWTNSPRLSIRKTEE